MMEVKSMVMETMFFHHRWDVGNDVRVVLMVIEQMLMMIEPMFLSL